MARGAEGLTRGLFASQRQEDILQARLDRFLPDIRKPLAVKRACNSSVPAPARVIARR